ncbi:methionine ABC transporter ATP-binding protein [Anaerosporobacter faecicola]|uniref:methionine ABC transporter ATP-binding protein n=1 Tax=Anaerosporobacter faecicola TaxID=2718714 RepID=UPI0014395659|nr:ATP-binding cassette domain-containing protein [Anaerosporobacter faecicola]
MRPMIQIKNVSKSFPSKAGKVDALQNISIDMEQGDIFGIIGMSGAGKSTLVRCINFLERPTEGTVLIDGKDLQTISNKELRKTRQEIAMIFQHFNLLMQRTVIDNICFPLEIAGVRKKKARERAKELLKIVGLEHKENAYPAQLSGGQKQRVAIARAIANNPKILLCDEATSALDPETTNAILNLLKDINKRFGITIVVITHEMKVIQKICNKVAILSGGTLAETGLVKDIFTEPKTEEAKRLVYQGTETTAYMRGKHFVRIVFNEQSSFEPVISNMILSFQTPINIMGADTHNIGGKAIGEMILQLPEEKEIADKMIAYLINRKLAVEEVDIHV